MIANVAYDGMPAGNCLVSTACNVTKKLAAAESAIECMAGYASTKITLKKRSLKSCGVLTQRNSRYPPE